MIVLLWFHNPEYNSKGALLHFKQGNAAMKSIRLLRCAKEAKTFKKRQCKLSLFTYSDVSFELFSSEK